jgi:hypothetical protein
VAGRRGAADRGRVERESGPGARGAAGGPGAARAGGRAPPPRLRETVRGGSVSAVEMGAYGQFGPVVAAGRRVILSAVKTGASGSVLSSLPIDVTRSPAL